MKGIIALDIDGTITKELHAIPSEIVGFLTQLNQEGWQIAFITGRTFQWCHEILKVMSFPYYLAVQNGATILEMPHKRILAKKYLDKENFSRLDIICEEQPTDFVIYSGFESDDVCYYRSSRFDPSLLKYLTKRCQAFDEVWKDVSSFKDLSTNVASIKCFGSLKIANEIAKRIEHDLQLQSPVIKDPFKQGYYVVQATDPTVTKGFALTKLIQSLDISGPVIAAGDDHNDTTMIAIADIKIVMATAPHEILQMADIIAPPAEQMGIIPALKQAILGVLK